MILLTSMPFSVLQHTCTAVSLNGHSIFSNLKKSSYTYLDATTYYYDNPKGSGLRLRIDNVDLCNCYAQHKFHKFDLLNKTILPPF
jgi:hypothetical protein